MSDKKWDKISSDEPAPQDTPQTDVTDTKTKWGIPAWITPPLATFLAVATLLVILQPQFVEIRNKDPMVSGRLCWIRVFVISAIAAIFVLVFPKISSYLGAK